MKVTIKTDHPSHYYTECNYTKGKVYEAIKRKGKYVVVSNNGFIDIDVYNNFNVYKPINKIGGEIL